MHEIISLLLFALSLTMVLTGGFWGVIGILVGCCTLFYFSASLVARFNKKMNSWFRIHPGTPTPMNETEWEALGDKSKAAALAPRIMPKPKPTTKRPLARQMPELSDEGLRTLAHQSRERTKPLAAAEPKPPEEVIYYDSGYEDMSTSQTSAPKGDLEKKFEEIFKVK